MKEGKKSRKFGRNGRSQSHKAYTAGRRWEVNKKKRIASHKARMEAKAEKRTRWEAKRKRAGARAAA